ncbi:hypothetical protein HDV57DRAFT_357361 [Trichoderma longibrachiatum]
MVLFGHGSPASLPSPDARASSSSRSGPQGPRSAAVHDALPRCDVVRSDPSYSVALRTGLICWRQCHVRSMWPALAAAAGKAALTLGLAITGVPKGSGGRNYSPSPISPSLVPCSPSSYPSHLALSGSRSKAVEKTTCRHLLAFKRHSFVYLSSPSLPLGRSIYVGASDLDSLEAYLHVRLRPSLHTTLICLGLCWLHYVYSHTSISSGLAPGNHCDCSMNLSLAIEYYF